MKHITIGRIEVPIADYAVGASAILGIRDSGKTVTAKGIAEQLLDHGIPIVVFDAVGKWQWLKVAGSRHGGKGYKVVVAGGRNPDLPLNPHSVPEIVRSALKERIPLIIDLYSKDLSKSDWRKIVKSAIHIIHYENESGPVHVFLEEAAEFVPQKVYDGDTYAEVEKLVRMGGNAQVGITLINQRSQEINKAVLDNCSTALVLGCQVGSNAIAAVGRWIERLEPDVAKEVTQSLPKLKSGDAWVWTRKSLDHPSLETMPMCRSLHPDRRTPSTLIESSKPADTSDFITKMASAIPKVIEEAKANDPAELRKEIASLKRQLQAKPVAVTPEPAIVTQHIIDNESKLLMSSIQSDVAKLAVNFDVLVRNADRAALKASKPALMKQVKQILTTRPAPSPRSNSDEKIGGGMKRMLTALAQRSPLSDRQLGVRAGLSSKSGTFGTYMASLRQYDCITGQRDSISITDEGIRMLGSYDPLPEGRELLNHWLQELGGGEKRMLQALADAYPDTMTDEALGEAAEISSASGTFGTYLAHLRTLELIEGKRDALKASDEFFQ